MKSFLKLLGKIILWILIILILAYGIFCLLVRPSQSRDWVKDNKVLAHADIDGDKVTIYNVRNNNYRSTLDFDSRYYDKTYDLALLDSVDFITAPFNPPTAHTFISFGFSDGSHVAISIEARREVDEFYNVFKGMLRQFEMIYVIADEADVIKLRTNYRSEGDVYLYPIKVSNEKAKALFLSMIAKTNELYLEPEFYNTITNNCTNNLVRHVNEVATKDARIGWSYKYALPAYTDLLAFERGLIDDTGTFEEIKARHLITQKAKSCHDTLDFSACIRE